MITLRDIVLRHGSNILLEGVNWTIYFKQRIGIVGANGSGKTSLLSLLLGQLQPDKGELYIPRKITFGYVAQETESSQDIALKYVLEGDAHLCELQKELAIAEAANDGEHIARLHARMGEIDAYTAESRAARLLYGLGFDAALQQNTVSSFSGGWRVRLNLARALMSRSDILLLDEPTNHLDLDAVLWLENWLKNYAGTLLIISHDRDFLDDVVDHIVHISDKNLKSYVGNYSSFEKQRAQHLLLQQALYEKQQKYISHLQSFISRFKAKATKARQAQSRVKALEKMEVVKAVQLDSPFQFSFKTPLKCPNPLVRLEDASISYDDHTILTNLNLMITPKDRIALLGPNGAGKSSLIKLLAGKLNPSEGVRQASEGLQIGYFDQHQVDYLLLDETPLHHLQQIAKDTRELELRNFLGVFGFSGDRVLEKVKNFSGGEKARLALALIVWQKPNLLLLDEPTNHLDLEMRQALSLALQDYAGAMIIVSHDRFLIRTTVDQLFLVANAKVEEFTGDMKDYEEWLFAFRKNSSEFVEEVITPALSRKSQRQNDAKMRELRRPLLQQIKKLEQEMLTLQNTQDENEKNLTDENLYHESRKLELRALLDHQAKIQKKLKEIEEEWLLRSEELTQLDQFKE